MKLLEIMDMIDIKDQQACSISFLIKKTGLGANVNEQLAEEFHKPVIKKLKRRKVYPRFKDNIWAAGLAEMVLRIKILNIYYVSQMFSLNTHGF